VRNGAPVPTLSRSEVVPVLRPDLLVGRGASPGLFELSDPKTGRSLILYEFELSVARMLDGRRKVSEVIENGDRLGIPVDAGGLARFVHHLRSQGFLAPPGTRPAAAQSATWAKRRAWDARTRSRFQEGVKLVRLGRPDEAVALFQAILAGDPQNAEAAEMLALVAAGHSLASRPIGEVFEKPARLLEKRRVATWGLAAAALLLAGAGAAAGWRWAAGNRTPAAGTPGTAAFEPEPTGRGSRRLASAPAPGRAEAPAALAAEPPRTPPVWRTAPVERRWHPTLAEIRSPAAGKVAWHQGTRLRVARGERVADVRATAEASAPGPEAQQRLAELQRLATEDPVYEEFLEKERAVLTGAAAGGRTFGIAAPAEGQLTPLAAADAKVGAGEVVARLVDDRAWRVTVLLRGDPPGSASGCELAGDGAADRAACQVAEVAPADDHHAVTLTVSAAAAPWLERARAPYARIGPAEGKVARKEAP